MSADLLTEAYQRGQNDLLPVAIKILEDMVGGGEDRQEFVSDYAKQLRAAVTISHQRLDLRFKEAKTI